MHIHVLRGQDGQERLKDLQLDTLVSVRAREAAADCVHDDVDLPLGRVLHADAGPGQVPVGDQLLDSVQRDDNQAGGLALTREAAMRSLLSRSSVTHQHESSLCYQYYQSVYHVSLSPEWKKVFVSIQPARILEGVRQD